MSALPPKADIAVSDGNVRFVHRQAAVVVANEPPPAHSVPENKQRQGFALASVPAMRTAPLPLEKY